MNIIETIGLVSLAIFSSAIFFAYFLISFAKFLATTVDEETV